MSTRRARRGRPPLPPSMRRERINLTLPAETIKRARELGDGIVSIGVERAIDAAYTAASRRGGRRPNTETDRPD